MKRKYATAPNPGTPAGAAGNPPPAATGGNNSTPHLSPLISRIFASDASTDSDSAVATLLYGGAAVALAGLGYYFFMTDSSVQGQAKGMAKDAQGRAQGMASEVEGRTKGMVNQAEGKVGARSPISPSTETELRSVGCVN